MVLPYTRHQAQNLPGAAALDIRAVCVSYPDTDHAALHAVSLHVPAGIRVALVGANGSGKSTLLKTIAGLLAPQSGSISIYGQPIAACHRRVAYLPQRSEIDWRFPVSVEQLVIAGRYVHLGWLRWPGRHDRALAAEVLERLGLSGLAQRQISQLSGGQQQRALLARALVQEADLLLLDEPLSAIDAASRQIIAGVLDKLRQQGKTALVATHHLDRLAEEFDRVIMIDDGQIAPVAGQLPTLVPALEAM